MAASHRDTPYALARRLFPPERVDAVRDEIVDLNAGRPLPDGTPYRGGGFPVGWDVVIPATPSSSALGTTDESTAAPLDASTVIHPDAPLGVHNAAGSGSGFELTVDSTVTVTVRDGDNLWKLAVAHHERAGVEASPPVIAAYVAEMAAINADQIDDPDIIYPGQRLVLPPVANVSTPAPAAEPALADPSTDGGQLVPIVHVVAPGDTVWGLLEGLHGSGNVTADMVWKVADDSGLEDPSTSRRGDADHHRLGVAGHSPAACCHRRRMPPPARSRPAGSVDRRSAIEPIPVPTTPTPPPAAPRQRRGRPAGSAGAAR